MNTLVIIGRGRQIIGFVTLAILALALANMVAAVPRSAFTLTDIACLLSGGCAAVFMFLDRKHWYVSALAAILFMLLPYAVMVMNFGASVRPFPPLDLGWVVTWLMALIFFIDSLWVIKLKRDARIRITSFIL